MPNDAPATIVVERAAGHVFPFGTPWVYIDRRFVGRLRRRRREFPVPAGEHAVWVVHDSRWTEGIALRLGAGERVEIVCKSREPPLSFWHVLAFWFLCFHVALDWVGGFIPGIRVFVRHYLALVSAPVLVVGCIGALLYFRRRHAIKRQRPMIWLEAATPGWSRLSAAG